MPSLVVSRVGAARMPVLSPGAYRLPAPLAGDGAHARNRPALVGLTPPDTGPPEEVIRSYLIAAGLLPPPVTGVDVDAEELQ